MWVVARYVIYYILYSIVVEESRIPIWSNDPIIDNGVLPHNAM